MSALALNTPVAQSGRRGAGTVRWRSTLSVSGYHMGLRQFPGLVMKCLPPAEMNLPLLDPTGSPAVRRRCAVQPDYGIKVDAARNVILTCPTFSPLLPS